MQPTSCKSGDEEQVCYCTRGVIALITCNYSVLTCLLGGFLAKSLPSLVLKGMMGALLRMSWASERPARPSGSSRRAASEAFQGFSRRNARAIWRPVTPFSKERGRCSVDSARLRCSCSGFGGSVPTFFNQMPCNQL